MTPRVRTVLVLLVLACGFTVISLNLVRIQLVEHDKFYQIAVANHLHPETIPPQRGQILDSDGLVLARTRQAYEVRLDGQLLPEPEKNLPKLAGILGLSAEELKAGFNPKNRYQLLTDDGDGDEVAQLRALKLNCLRFEPHSRRIYPNNQFGAHLLGFVDDATGRGMAGVEKDKDAALNGTAGVRWVERDARHNEIAGYQRPGTPAINGDDVVLTVKLSIQTVVEQELDQIEQQYHPAAAHIIVMQPHTGEILALGSRPDFDPNDRATFKPENLRNRCLTDMVEPGSIFKIITLAGALNEGGLSLDTPIFCENGRMTYCGRVLRDDEPNGTLPAIEVLAQSSNIGFFKIAANYLHEQKLYDYATAFGIGQRTGLFGQQGESAGLLRPLDKWSGLSISRIPMGQEVGATPMQMTAAMSVIANGGRLVEPHVVRTIRDEQGRDVQVFPPRVVRQVVSAETARKVARALEQVTITGTAKNIHIDGYSFAGKTGTAQKFVDGAYSHTKFVSSFIGFMPVEDPAFVALVMVDEPQTRKYYGSEVSAPVFADLARQVAQVLNLTPDRPVATPSPVPSAAAAAGSPTLTSYRPPL